MRTTSSDSTTSDPQRVLKTNDLCKTGIKNEGSETREVKLVRFSTRMEKNTEQQGAVKTPQKTSVYPVPSGEILCGADGVGRRPFRVKQQAHHLSRKVDYTREAL